MANVTTTGQGSVSPRALGLFALPFLAVGVGMLLLAVLPTLHDWYRMQAWYPVRAEVLSASLDTRHGDDGATWKAEVSYRYRVGGRTYTGTRVAINDSGADNIGDFQKRMAAELSAAQRAGRPVEVWVNPDDPADAVYNRELRAGLFIFYLVFTLVFGGAGVGMLALARRGDGSTGVTVPDQPWLSRTDWASPVIHARQAGATGLLWFFAVVWCALSLPATLAIPTELAAGNHAILLILLFDLIGLWLLATAIRQTLAARRYGDTVLLMDPHPASVGGEVSGYFDVPLPNPGEQVYEVDLACLRTWVSGSGKNRSTRHDVLWQETRRLHGEPGEGGQTRVWFAFSAPAGLPVSAPPSDDYHHWKLTAHADVPGVDFSRSWELPVFATGTAGSGTPRRRMRVAVAAEAAAVEAATGFTQTAGGAAMDYGAGRHWLSALLLLLVFGGGFGGGGIAILFAAGDVLARWLLGPLFGVIGLVCALSGIWMLGNRLRVEGDLAGVRIRRWLFGIPVASHDLARGDIDGIGISQGGTLTVGSKVTQFYDLVLRLQDGRHRQIGRGLQGAAQATQAAESFALYTRLPFRGEFDAQASFRARKAAYQAGRRDSR